jgi:hypothetical protein
MSSILLHYRLYDVTGRINPRMDYAFCLLHIEEFWKMAIPIIWCYMYMQLQSPNSTLRYTIFNIHVHLGKGARSSEW